MKAVVTVIGEDRVGIIAKVSACLADYSINILDINQTIMGNLFTMIMMVDTKDMPCKFFEISEKMEKLGDELGVKILMTQEEIYKSMHRI